MADETESLEDALQKCVDIVCKMIDWPVGHAYVPSSGRLEPTTIWHFDDERKFATLRDVTERPEGVDAGRVVKTLLTEHGIEIGGGLGELAGRVWRVGLMGHNSRRDNVERLMAALREVL